MILGQQFPLGALAGCVSEWGTGMLMEIMRKKKFFKSKRPTGA